MRDADCARGRGHFGSRAATKHQRGHVHIVAFPIGGHRNAEGRARFGVDGLHMQQMIALDQQQTLAGLRRRDRDLQHVAGAIRGLVERELDLVRARIEASILVVPAPAGLKRITTGEPRFRIEYFQPVFAPLDRKIHFCVAGRDQIQGLAGDVLETRREVVVPAVIGPRPAIIAALAHQRDLQSFGGQTFATRIHTQQFEAGVRIRRRAILAVEQRAHADQCWSGPEGAFEHACDGATAGFVHAAGDDCRDWRLRGFRLVGHCDVLLVFALRVELLVDDVLGIFRQADGRIAEVIILQRVDRVLLGSHGQACGETIAIGRRAVQIRRSRDQFERLAGMDHCLRTVQIELHALWQKLFDAQRERLHHILAGWAVAIFDLPTPGRRIGGNRVVPRVIAQRARFDAGLQEVAAIRLFEGQK